MSKLTRPVTIPRWKHHAGHTLTAGIVAFTALGFNAPFLLATLLGTVAWPLLHEFLERFFYPGSTAGFGDHVADVLQHQPLWVVYFLRAGEPAVAVAIAALIGVLYWTTLDWCEP